MRRRATAHLTSRLVYGATRFQSQFSLANCLTQYANWLILRPLLRPFARPPPNSAHKKASTARGRSTRLHSAFSSLGVCKPTMDVLLFERAKFERYYNCTNYNISQLPLDQRQHPRVGVFFLLVFVFFLVLYSLCLVAMVGGRGAARRDEASQMRPFEGEEKFGEKLELQDHVVPRPFSSVRLGFCGRRPGYLRTFWRCLLHGTHLQLCVRRCDARLLDWSLNLWRYTRRESHFRHSRFSLHFGVF